MTKLDGEILLCDACSIAATRRELSQQRPPRLAADLKHWSWWADEATPPRDPAQHALDAWGFPESYSINGATKEAALQAARREFGADVHIALTEATQDGPFETDLFEGDAKLIELVLEAFAEQNEDRFGEDGFDGDVDQDKLATHLNRALAEFFATHGRSVRVWSFTEQRNREIIAPETVA